MRVAVLTTTLYAAIVTAQTQYLESLLRLNPDLSSFSNALHNVSSFARSLNGNSNVTIFTPTNQAFDTLLAGSNTPERRAVSGGNKDELEKLLAFHVVSGTYTTANFTTTQTSVNTLSYRDTGFSSRNLTASEFTGPTIGLVKNGTNATILSGQMQSSNVVQAASLAVVVCEQR
jgi:uncharacterized surface protein with fasciclin (FAS1) repeats